MKINYPHLHLVEMILVYKGSNQIIHNTVDRMSHHHTRLIPNLKINDFETLEWGIPFKVLDVTLMLVLYGQKIYQVLEENGEKKYEYKKMKYIELDFAKLKRGEYHIDELIEEDVETKIGEIDGKGVYRKSGPYGDYIEYNNIRESVESLNVESADEIIEKVKNKVKNEKIIRPLGENMSIRNGKYGAYIYYKTKKMKKPRFLNLSKFPESYRFCEVEKIKDWIKNEYKIFEI